MTRVILAIALVIAIPVISSAANVSFVGSTNYSLNNTTVALTANEIQNNSASGVSGNLRLELWAFPFPTAVRQYGYALATYTLPQQLNAGSAITNISSGPIAYQPPAAGVWYFTLFLTEYDGSAFQPDDFVTFQQPVVCTSTACGSGNMSYHGGEVQHGQKVYTIFWDPRGGSFPAGYESTINQFIGDLDGSSYYSIASQYGDSTGPVSSAASLAGTWVDTVTALPTSPVSVQSVLTEVVNAFSTNNWTVDDNSLFLLYTPSSVTNDSYCGYHSAAVNTVTGQKLAFGLILYPETKSNGSTCLIYSPPWPNSQIVDQAISATAHEVIETVTNPFGGGWYLFSGSGEIGDLCLINVGPRDSFGADLQLNGHKYLVQTLWNNADSNCAMSSAPAGDTVSLSSNSVSFANQAIGTSSLPQAITITSTGTAAVTISSMTIGGANPGDFVQTSNCPTTLGASCTIRVSFQPTALGMRTATIAIADNALGSPQQLTLTGMGAMVSTTSPTTGATASTHHVFPQIADGFFSDGSYFQSTLVVTNSTPSVGAAACTFQMYGVTVNGQSQISFNVGTTYRYATPGSTQALQTGYGALQCSSKVEAQLLYSFYDGAGIKQSEATVFSSPPATMSRIVADYRGGSRLGLAIANDSNQSNSYSIRVFDAGGNIIGVPTITLAANQNRAAFIDEFVALPDNYYGFVDIVANSGPASVIGLSFTGAAFTTIPAAMLITTSATASTYHVFPQIADGFFSDGSYFQSTLVVTNSNPFSGAAACTFQMHGLTVNGQTQVLFNVSGSFTYATPGNTGSLQTGFGSLQCSSNVEAQLLYSFYNSAGIKQSEATVFSSPPATMSRIVADYTGGSRLGLAMANDSNQSNSYTIRVYDAGGNVIGSTNITLAAEQSRAAFIDELVTLPANYYGFVDIIPTGGSDSTIGLSFTGAVFTTIPAVTIAP